MSKRTHLIMNHLTAIPGSNRLGRSLLPALILGAFLSAFLSACTESDQSAEQTASPQPATASSNTPANASSEQFTVLISGTEIGELDVRQSSDSAEIDYEYRNNGRGPTIKESVQFDDKGLPTRWTIEGATSFGNQVDEEFVFDDGRSNWRDNTGVGSTQSTESELYVAQGASPFALWIYARALLADSDRSMEVLPAGTLNLDEIETFEVSGPDGPLQITSYALSGISYHPTYLLLDAEEQFFGTMSPRFALLREGYEGEDERVRGLAEIYSANRLERIQAEVAHEYDDLIIDNVHVFDPASKTRSEPQSVRVTGNRITAVGADIDRAGAKAVIDGNGGTLVAGMFDMHGHFSQNSALLNIAAGVTSIRDMGNNNAVLSALIGRIEEGTIGGPRVVRSGFIEGKSPYSSNNGQLVETEEQAVEAVRRYGTGEFYQIKIYNSMNPDWVPAMVAEAKANGLRVAGHVPAFSNADAMIAAGYNELTHINQVMLGWVLEPEEDTRTLLRLTALKRLPGLDLESDRVNQTINAMASGNVALDPTLAIHEALLRSRNGTVAPGIVDYVDHLPLEAQRQARTAWSDVSDPADDTAYWAAFDKIIATLAIMHERGVFLVPGTDLGGSFAYHRELELYQGVGMNAAEVLAWSSHGMADYLGLADDLGSVETGKLADFYLVPGDPTEDLKAIKTISLVVKDGMTYFPSEIYPEFGIKPFLDAPDVVTVSE